jgi:uncharacterized damage-inducible protein DinB
MSQNTNFKLLADYNIWMNTKLYDAAATLSAAELVADKGAFFGSILGTLNHIVVADTVWLQRFALLSSSPQAPHDAEPHAALAGVCQLPTPTSLNALLFADLPELRQRRELLDAAISSWVAVLSDDDLSQNVQYSNMKGTPQCKPLDSLLLHFFNHQTHHRGQASTLLFQAGVDVGETDLRALIPDKLS